MPQTLDMIPHPVTLSWHWVDQSYLYPVSLSAKWGAATTIFNDFGICRDLPFPEADTLPTELPGPVAKPWHIQGCSWQAAAVQALDPKIKGILRKYSQPTNLENRRLGLIESVHEIYWRMQHP